ncbi:MAG TPA: TetR/AcrR family transcriptional regulator [bacterium]|nr:TetR/AcrR family transcriptional regulator [bacterium]
MENLSGAAPVRRGRKGGRSSDRGNLVSEAMQLLSKEGVEGMSIGMLAQRSGYSKGGIMAHFTSKSEMVLLLIDEGVTRTRRFFREELKNSATPRDRLSRTLQAYGEYWSGRVFEGGCLFLNLAVDAIGEDEIAQALRKAARMFISDFASIVRIGQATGDFRPDVDADEIGEKLMTICMGCAWTARMTGDRGVFARMQPEVDAIVGNLTTRRDVGASIEVI